MATLKRWIIKELTTGKYVCSSKRGYLAGFNEAVMFSTDASIKKGVKDFTKAWDHKRQFVARYKESYTDLPDYYRDYEAEMPDIKVIEIEIREQDVESYKF